MQPFNCSLEEKERGSSPAKSMRTITPVSFRFTGDNFDILIDKPTCDIVPITMLTEDVSSDKVIEPYDEYTIPEARAYEELLDTYSLHQFIIRKGKVLNSTPEFISFRRKYACMWNNVKRVIKELEALSMKYNFVLAHVNGIQVAELAQLNCELSMEQLLSCLQNRSELHSIIYDAGSKALARSLSEEKAAIKIQSACRMFLCKKSYAMKLKMHRAAKIIQLQYRLFLLHRETRRKIETVRAHKFIDWRKLMFEFSSRWNHIIRKRRVIVHIPSLSYSAFQRNSMHNFTLHENNQLGRLCSVVDPLVDVIYISPYPLSDELQQYYFKLFKSSGITDAVSRIKILYPENHNQFPEHFSLAQKLYYSPKCMKRILQHIRNRAAYIVPNHVGAEDLLVAMHLKLPLLGPTPEQIRNFGCKSGFKRIFAAGGVNTPPSSAALYTFEAIVDHLSRLIMKHLQVKRWLLKIDDEFNGRGTAWFEPGEIKVFHVLLADHADGKIQDQSEQSAAISKLKQALVSNLSGHVKFANQAIYPCMTAFLQRVAIVGCIIEASPPEIIGSPTANIFIEPDGTCRVVSTHDQIFPRPYTCAGVFYPQQSVPFDSIAAASQSIGKACYQRGIIGYVGISYVVCSAHLSRDADYSDLRLYAVDLNLKVTNSACSFQLFDFLMQGRTRLNGEYMIERNVVSNLLPSASTDKHDAIESSRFYCFFNYLYSSDLVVIPLHAFLNLFRLNNFSFDNSEKVGITLLMMDSLASGALGFLASGESKVRATANGNKIFELLMELTKTTISSVSTPRDDESNLTYVYQSFRNLLKSGAL